MFKNRKRLIALAALVTAVIAVVLTIVLRPRDVWPQELQIATATLGGTYADLGEEFAEILREQLPEGRNRVAATISAGSVENMKRLISKEAHLAFVAGSALSRATRKQKKEIRVLAYLFPDVVQFVVPEGTALGDLKNPTTRPPRIYVGKLDSATRLIAKALLESVGIEDYEPYPPEPQPDAEPEPLPKLTTPTNGDQSREGEDWGYTYATERLLDGELEAGIYAAGTPTKAVTEALANGCVILDLVEDQLDNILASLDSLNAEKASIPGWVYGTQKETVHTVSTPVFLGARKDLDDDLVFLILDTLFENLGELLQHATAEKIRFQNAFAIQPPAGFKLHAGARRFRNDEAKKLIIATGPMTGKYHPIGKQIKILLEQEEIEARVIHTDGSLENAQLLQSQKLHTMAIMQSDVAIAMGLGSRAVYRDDDIEFEDESGNPLRMDVHRIATLWDEKVYVVAREEILRDDANTLDALKSIEDLKVCMGAKNSGTQLLAQAVFTAHGVTVKEQLFLPPDVMAAQLRSGRIDAAVVVSGQPSDILRELLNDPDFRLLELDWDKTKKLTQSATFRETRIDHGGESIKTISTRAVLVTTDDLPDVKKITRAIHAGYAILGVAETLATAVPSLPLHPDAEAVYRELLLLPDHPRPHWLEVIAAALTVIVVVVGTAKGFRLLVRERIVNQVKGRVLDIPLDSALRDAIPRLSAVRNELRERARKKWWDPGHLDKSRWNDLAEMLDNRIEEAKSALTRGLLGEVRCLQGLDDSLAIEQGLSLRQRAWRHAENGYLDEAQLGLVLRALEEVQSKPRPEYRTPRAEHASPHSQ